MGGPRNTGHDVRQPTVSLLCKLGSIVLHVEEGISPRGHTADLEAAKAMLGDPEIVAWMAAMDEVGLIPVKR